MRYYAEAPPPEGLVRNLAQRLEVQVLGHRVRAQRRRAVPRRGFFRLVIPQARAWVEMAGATPRVSVRPDGWAIFMCVMLLGGVVAELTMDRLRYPREYPPAFVFVSAGLYVAALVIELVRTRRAVREALAT